MIDEDDTGESVYGDQAEDEGFAET